MIGSIDCMHWEWKNCPTAWEGQYTRGDKGTTTVILEAVASHDLWIWHAFFGCPGTLNDINVLDRSPVFDDVEQGTAPRVNFFVNQRPYNMAYYLADGIYPPYPTFVKSIRLPQSEPDKLFAKYQEGCRKDIERAFGVLQARFKIIREPARMWDIVKLFPGSATEPNHSRPRWKREKMMWSEKHQDRLCNDGGLTLFMPLKSAAKTVRICVFPAGRKGLKGIGISPDCNQGNKATPRQLFNWALEPAKDAVLEKWFEIGYQDAAAV
ncbi:hypothetical protein QQ045_005715 [Rhodiola kirilowii]